MGLFHNFQALFLLVMFIVTWEAPAMVTSTQTTVRGVQSFNKFKDLFVISPYPTVVTIYNDLGEGLDLTIHCKSKDDDLGTHVIPYGNKYDWSFHVNFWGTTLFFCGFSWRDGSGIYDIYTAKRDLRRCPVACLWKAIRDGVHGYKEGEVKEDDVMYRWGTPPK